MSPPSSDESDEVLMAQVRRGNHEAFAVLLARYRVPVFSYLVRMTGRRSDAEEVYQETFLKLFEHRMRYRPGAPFRPWLYRIASNAARDLLRKRSRREVLGDAAALEDTPAYEFQPERAPSPSEAARHAETRARLEAAVGNLPEHLRAVFLLARYHELSYPEIAESLDIPVGTIKSRMHEAVKRLREWLGDMDR